MRVIDIKAAQAALLETAAECRAAAFCATDLTNSERHSLLLIANLVERQARGEHVVRRTLGSAIDRLIDMLDRIDEPAMDAEPWLGAPEQHPAAWGYGCDRHVALDQSGWATGTHDDREDENEHGTDLDGGEEETSSATR